MAVQAGQKGVGHHPIKVIILAGKVAWLERKFRPMKYNRRHSKSQVMENKHPSNDQSEVAESNSEDGVWASTVEAEHPSRPVDCRRVGNLLWEREPAWRSRSRDSTGPPTARDVWDLVSWMSSSMALAGCIDWRSNYNSQGFYVSHTGCEEDMFVRSLDGLVPRSVSVHQLAKCLSCPVTAWDNVTRW